MIIIIVRSLLQDDLWFRYSGIGHGPDVTDLKLTPIRNVLKQFVAHVLRVYYCAKIVIIIFWMKTNRVLIGAIFLARVFASPKLLVHQSYSVVAHLSPQQCCHRQLSKKVAAIMAAESRCLPTHISELITQCIVWLPSLDHVACGFNIRVQCIFLVSPAWNLLLFLRNERYMKAID